MKPSEDILNMVHAFSDEGRRQAVRDLAARVEALEGFVRDCRDNFDCDTDGHRYGTYCRCCEAKELLEESDNEAEKRNADRIDGYDRDDIGESPDL